MHCVTLVLRNKKGVHPHGSNPVRMDAFVLFSATRITIGGARLKCWHSRRARRWALCLSAAGFVAGVCSSDCNRHAKAVKNG
ncbi:MAG TPA: hypothetical protein VIR60_06510 [Gammaproteobacteria bacterium]